MFPLSDPDIYRRTRPVITLVFIAFNVLVFLYQITLNELDSAIFTYRFGVIPAEILGGKELTSLSVWTGFRTYPIDISSPIPTLATMVSSMFMHGGFMHLAGNMMYLWVFGNTVEDLMNHWVFIMFYLIAGIGAVLAQSAIDTNSTIPMVGASGAVSGILGVYLVLYPLSRINTVVIFGIITTVRVPAYIFLGIWFLLQLFNGLGSIGPEVANSGGVAYFAHLGGFIVGLGFGLIYKFFGRGKVLEQVSQSEFIADDIGIDDDTYYAEISFCRNCGSDAIQFLEIPVERWYCNNCRQHFK